MKRFFIGEFYEKIIKVLLTSFVVFSMFSCATTSQVAQPSQVAETTNKDLIGEWVADEVPSEIKEIILSITDSHLVEKTTASSGEVATMTCKYTNDNSKIYMTVESFMVDDNEMKGAKGEKGVISYILKNNTLQIDYTADDNKIILKFHKK